MVENSFMFFVFDIANLQHFQADGDAVTVLNVISLNSLVYKSATRGYMESFQ